MSIYQPAIPMLLQTPLLILRERATLYEALRQSEECFAKVMQATPAAVALVRPRGGAILDVPDRFLQLLGYTVAEVIGLPPNRPRDRAATNPAFVRS